MTRRGFSGWTPASERPVSFFGIDWGSPGGDNTVEMISRLGGSVEFRFGEEIERLNNLFRLAIFSQSYRPKHDLQHALHGCGCTLDDVLQCVICGNAINPARGLGAADTCGKSCFAELQIEQRKHLLSRTTCRSCKH